MFMFSIQKVLGGLSSLMLEGCSGPAVGYATSLAFFRCVSASINPCLHP